MRKSWLLLGLVASISLAGSLGVRAADKTVWDGVFTSDQSDRGADVIGDSCAKCHGNAMRGSPGGPTVVGTLFDHWGNQPLSNLYDFITTKMPADNPGSLDPHDAADALAHILDLAGVPAGSTELPPDDKVLSQITVTAKK